MSWDILRHLTLNQPVTSLNLVRI